MPDESSAEGVVQSDASALTPAAVVERLGRHIIGQDRAKRAVAVALRNRWRQAQLPPDLERDVVPKNILMIGPTGVGKTEIARRLAQLVSAPFVKVEASRFTEVGYQGRDVQSMVRDLVKAAVSQIEAEESALVRERARERAEERVLDALIPPRAEPTETEAVERRRERLRAKLRSGELDSQDVRLDLEVESQPLMNVFSTMGGEELGSELREAMERMVPRRTRSRTLTVGRARRVLEAEEVSRLLDKEKIAREAIRHAERQGIIFIDEMDKVVGAEAPTGPDVSREGVQRDLLPLVEGSSVVTRWGVVRTDHVLFIAAGAFHASNPSDLIPELQGRFPIRVRLDALGKEEYLRILVEPENSLVKQYTALLATEGVELEFEPKALEYIAEAAMRANSVAQDIGARRLHTVLEKLLEDISFNAPDMRGKKVVIDWITIESKMESILEDEEQAKTEL
ncbi:MAG: ATP-dependent protease ATPase subunit HslU [Planctomycetota bacterium]|jgi:ATP-dependent HslUV protease ATP-binding subunit HslU